MSTSDSKITVVVADDDACFRDGLIRGLTRSGRSEVAGGLADEIRLRARSQAPVLSERERQVLEAFARGLSIPQVASELYISPSTVKTHTQRLSEKLGVSERAAAVSEALRRGLLE